ncbi:unnamed protein product [Prorocentrum cordatum]|uniref:Protein kinase domain-containing protein n=1 Tax=Prorocentrum cordatum TaxID=2364126 RepID=A0ABN9SLF7_9DINO|nr:unnamed protein product [Polarella glacialis]
MTRPDMALDVFEESWRDEQRGSPRWTRSTSSPSRQETMEAPPMVMCDGCGSRCELACALCAVCGAPPRLSIGGWSFVGETRPLYTLELSGPLLANSTVYFGRARRPGRQPCGTPQRGFAGMSRAAGGLLADREGEGLALARKTSGLLDDHEGDADQAKELLVAAKCVSYRSEAADVEMAWREIAVFRAFGSVHPHLLPLLFGGADGSGLVLLSPYAPGGDLYKLMYVGSGTYKCLEEKDGGYLTSQLLSGIAALHGARFLHGDIKPCNIYLTRVRDAYVAQLGDFGLTREVPLCEDGVPHVGGTSGYMAPEMVGQVVGVDGVMVSFAADLFALGVVVYQMMAGMSPFFPVSNVRAPLEFDGACWDPLDEEARSFVSMLLAKSPEARGTAEFALTHPWLALSSNRPRGVPRPPFAPKPADAIRFQPVSRTVGRGRSSPGAAKARLSLVRPSVCAAEA